MDEKQVAIKLGTDVMGWDKETAEYLFPVWNPLKSIFDAFQLAEKLYIAIVPQSASAPEEMRFMAFIENDPAPKIEVFAKTAPEAICKAALEKVN